MRVPSITSTTTLPCMYYAKHHHPSHALMLLFICFARRFPSSPLVHFGRRPAAATTAPAAKITGHTPLTQHTEQGLVTVPNDNHYYCYLLMNNCLNSNASHLNETFLATGSHTLHHLRLQMSSLQHINSSTATQ